MNTCKHCGVVISYFKSDVCAREQCITRVQQESEFKARFKGKRIRDALLGARRMGIHVSRVAELLGLERDDVDFEWYILKQDAR